MQEQIYHALVHEKESEITWQSLLYDLMKREDMDPWDVNVSKLSQRYIEALRELKEHDFRISGKVVLAAAMLLKLKSTRFVENDLMELDRLIQSSKEQDIDEDQFYEDIEQDFHIPGEISQERQHKLIPRTPQPRKRKVSIYDLMNALDQALEVRRRRIINAMPPAERFETPKKKVDIMKSIKQVYDRICEHYDSTEETLTFSNLIPSHEKEAKVLTFMPLLHLTTLGRVDLHQEKHLAEIDINLLKNDGNLESEIGQLEQEEES